MTVNSVKIKLMLIEEMDDTIFSTPTNGRGQIQLSLSRLNNSSSLYNKTRSQWMKEIYSSVLSHYITGMQNTLSDMKKYMLESTRW